MPERSHLTFDIYCCRISEQLPELLSSCDYVCNVLPSIQATDGLLDNEVLSHCQHKARGNTLSSLFSLIRKHSQSEDHNPKLLLKLEVKFMMMMVAMV